MRKRVVITGMGVVAPNGIGLEVYERALRAGQSGIRYIPEMAEKGFACQVAGIPPDFEAVAKAYFPQNELLSVHDNVGYATVAALDAWRDGGFEVPTYDDDRVDWHTGAIIGSGVGGIETLARIVVPMVNEGKVKRLGSRIVEQVMSSGASAMVAGLLALGNQVTANSSACSTGNEAIIEGMIRIRTGRAKRMLAGGTEGASVYIWAGFDAMKVICRKFNDVPERASRPMSASAAGFVPGSGAGILLLEELETALKRGARIYAEIIGGSVNCGGQRMGGSITAPNPQGVIRCVQMALEDAGISPHEIDLINGHLTATFADPLEVKNWSQALGRGPEDFPYIQSTKSLVGHALGAAGGLECVAVALQLYKGFIHPSINAEDVHPDISDYSAAIPHVCMEVPALRIAAKAGFGFGDVNSCLLLKKWEGE